MEQLIKENSVLHRIIKLKNFKVLLQTQENFSVFIATFAKKTNESIYFGFDFCKVFFKNCTEEPEKNIFSFKKFKHIIFRVSLIENFLNGMINQLFKFSNLKESKENFLLSNRLILFVDKSVVGNKRSLQALFKKCRQLDVKLCA